MEYSQNSIGNSIEFQFFFSIALLVVVAAASASTDVAYVKETHVEAVEEALEVVVQLSV